MAKTGMQMVLEAMGLNTTEIHGMIDKAKVEIPELAARLEATVNDIQVKVANLEQRTTDLVLMQTRIYDECASFACTMLSMREYLIRAEARELAREQILNPSQQEDFPLADSEQPISDAAMESFLEKTLCQEWREPDDGGNKRE